MKLQKMYEKIIQEGIGADPRGKSSVLKTLKKAKSRYEKLPTKEKDFFDRERLENPYEDTRILFGSPQTEIKTMLVGIDIDGAELLLIERLNEKRSKKIDLAFSHHPQGRAFASFYEVMDMQTDILNGQGVPLNICEGLIEKRKNQVARRVHAANHYRNFDIASILKIPFLCAHTPADNQAVSFLTKLMEKKKPYDLEELLNILYQIEEYKLSRKQKSGPFILFGTPQRRCGKIFVDMTGGTEGPKEMIEPLQRAGVGTIIAMHLSEEHYRTLQGKNINVIVAGHIASDNLGMNLLLDRITASSKIEILSCSGFRRVER